MANSDHDPDELFDEQGAAEFLKMSERTLQAWRAKTVGPAWVKVGRAIRYRRRHLVDWLNLNTCGVRR